MSKLKQGLLFFGAALFALAAGALLRGQLMDSHQSLPIELSKKGANAIFAATLPDIQGENQAISQWKGNVLVINFWATWCAPCREEIPEFIELQEKYHDQGLRFIGIAIDQEEKVIAYSKEFSINYPVLIGGSGAMVLAEAAGNTQSALPYTLVINREGEIVNTFLGRVHQKKLEKVLKPLLQDKIHAGQPERKSTHG
ncbi:MAG: TlpA disulfide reductase family protein [Nitrosomonas sp.]|nr:TlpA disulfide reductase family protein [Nitrosomonas sp.]MDP1950694.1 TlpA disulfide reductase family protein [Nitrosomonas sp.]